MRLPLNEAVAATAATLVDAAAAPPSLQVGTDTRTLQPGDAFLALRGEHFDGHEFTAQAVARGASLLIVESDSARVPGVATLIVRDTLKAYMGLAALARDRFVGRVMAITGSAGKTTTKSFLLQLLRTRYGERVIAAPANENNEIGVSKLLLSLSNEAQDAVVVEMGARRSGDIAALVEVARPHVGVLTNVGDAHLEIMGSRPQLEETKWALFSCGAHAVLNSRDDVSRRRSPSLAELPDWFAAWEEDESPSRDAELRPYTALLGNGRLLHRDGAGGTLEHSVEVRVPGLHNHANLAAAIAASAYAGASFAAIAAAIGSVTLPQGRYDRIDVEGLQIIYDAYNANASAMMATLDAFAGEKAARRIAVLASMAELGEESQALHERVGAHAARRVDVLLVSGESAAALARGARRGGLGDEAVISVDTNAAAARWLREHARDDDIVLLKGSRKYQLEEIVEELRS
jgi:UDP-N-acetylmuramoyl-tripeptide--D-alanyl-D-alanine ligase